MKILDDTHIRWADFTVRPGMVGTPSWARSSRGPRRHYTTFLSLSFLCFFFSSLIDETRARCARWCDHIFFFSTPSVVEEKMHLTSDESTSRRRLTVVYIGSFVPKRLRTRRFNGFSALRLSFSPRFVTSRRTRIRSRRLSSFR